MHPQTMCSGKLHLLGSAPTAQVCSMLKRLRHVIGAGHTVSATSPQAWHAWAANWGLLAATAILARSRGRV